MRIVRAGALLLLSTSLLAGCSSSPDDGRPQKSEVWETCRDYIKAEAGAAIPSIVDFDAMSVEISEQGTGWLVKGTASPDDLPKQRFYCQLDEDLSISDSIVTAT